MSELAPDIIATVPKNRQEDVRVSLSEFRGTSLIDLRTYSDIAGERRATKKGVSLNVAHLPALIDALQEAASEAHKRGLISIPADRPQPWWDRD